MNIPACPNFLEKKCPQSETYVSKETDEGFVIRCQTCGCMNFWPKDRNEKHAKYEAFLKRNADMEARRRAIESAPAYSFPGGKI